MCFGTFGQAVSEKIKKNRPIRNKKCGGRLFMDRDEMCTLYRETSIATSYKVSAYLAKRSQRKRFL